MADTYTDSYTLKIDMLFVDEDTRAITLKNPRTDIQTEEITDLNSFMQTKNIVVSDKSAATFGRITKVTKIQKRVRKLDIT